MALTEYPLQAVFAELAAWLADNAEDASHRSAAWREGSEHLAAHESPPRVVWYPLQVRERDKDEAPIPPVQASLDPEMGGFEEYWEAVDVDVWQVAVHCWGESRADAWGLYREVRRAIYALDRRSVIEFTGATWLRAEAGATTDLGAVLVAQFEVHVPLTMAASEVVTVTAAAGTTYLDRRREGGALEAGC